MEVLHSSCAGLDVHKKTVMACVRKLVDAKRSEKHVRQFGTTSRDILELAAWLKEHGVTHVAMESTGVLWKPFFNLLEGQFEVLLCNAQHIKQVPGRKTDVKDCEWIAQLLQVGLLKPSFVPSRPQRDFRDLTRHRAQLASEQTRVVNRLHKILEDTNIKLGAVATDIMGKSGRLMLDRLIAGETDPEVLAGLALGKMRAKIPQLRLALQGGVTDHHRFMLAHLLNHFDFITKQIDEIDRRIAAHPCAEPPPSDSKEEAPLPFAEAVELIDTIPGFDRVASQALVAEIGTDMARFPSEKHLASWAGICPGNNESAGKRRNQQTPRGNRWLRRVMTQAAWASMRKKDCYFAAQYRRICKRRGKKRALVAVGHSMLHVAYHILTERVPYTELGADFFDRLKPEQTRNYHVRRLHDLGYEVQLTPRQSA